MSLKPWREVITPHNDVLEGTFKQSEFAADISQVHSGKAPVEYQNAERFYSRTFITEGMELLLRSVAERLAGKGGDPVIQLQTAFGGGKTHTLLAVYHLAKREVETSRLAGISPILDSAGITNLPKARVAVIDGIRLSPSQPRKYGAKSVHTLWGELAWQLSGEEGYRLLEASDRDGTNPGKEILAQLLEQSAPCVILMDELVAYVRQFDEGTRLPGGTFDSNLTFIQALTEAVKSVKNAILLASLPESELEAGSVQGQKALDALSKYFGRLESVWKAVGKDEAFEIVKRRLFDGFGNRGDAENVARAFYNLYIDNNARFPKETQENAYLQKLIDCYPIHPEVFERLYTDWSTLEKFQRTRGVLQYLAIVIHRLWNSDNRDLMIMPASIPLEDSTVRAKSIHYLPQGWDPIIESEVDGKTSTPFEIDGREPRFGSLQAARRVARSVFMGSAPATSQNHKRGITVDRILLATAQPGNIVGIYEDALKRLRDKLQYLFTDDTNFWFDTRPNLRKEMEARKLRLTYQEDLLPCLREKLGEILKGGTMIGGIHIFSSHADIPDEVGGGPRLVVLGPETQISYTRSGRDNLEANATEILRTRGTQPRQRMNRLLFLVADAESVGHLREATKGFLAWRSIVHDQTRDFKRSEIQQAQREWESSEKILRQAIRNAYKWLMAPREEIQASRSQLQWEYTSFTSQAGKLIDAIEAKLKEEEWVIQEWSPVFLKQLLNQYYFKDGNSDVPTRRIFNDFASYLYLPRLVDERTLKATIEQGIMSEDFFAYAQGKETGKYLGLTLGGHASVGINEVSLLVESNAAKAVKAAAIPAGAPLHAGLPTASQGAIGPGIATTTRTQPMTGSATSTQTRQPELKTRFFAIKDLNTLRASKEFHTILEEVILRLTERHTTSVAVTLEIHATDDSGFEEALQRTLTENCRTLAFKAADFSRE